MFLYTNIGTTFCCLLLATSLSAHEVNLNTHNLAPYSTYIDGKISGTAVEVLRCTEKKLEYTAFIISVYPWKRAQHMVKSHASDGFFAASHSAERDEYAVMSNIIAEQQWTWYLAANNTANPNDNTFKQNAIVTSFLGANMQSWLIDNKYRLGSFLPANNEQLLKLLIHDRVDAILANNQVMEKLIQQEGVKDKLRSVTHTNKPLGVYFSKQFLLKRPHFLDQFNSAVDDCRHKKSTP